MSIFLFQIIFFSILNTSIQVNQLTIYNSNNDELQGDSKECLTKLFACMLKKTNTSKIICIINITKYEPDNVYNLLQIDYIKDIVLNILDYNFPIIKNVSLHSVIQNFLNLSKPYLNRTFELIKTVDNSSHYLLDYLLDVFIYYENTSVILKDYFLGRISNILNFPGFVDLISQIGNLKDILFTFMEIYLDGTKFSYVSRNLKDLRGNYGDIIYHFLYKFLTNYNNETNLVNYTYNFVLNNEKFMYDLKKKFENIDMVQSFGNSFDIPDSTINSIKNSIFSSTEVVKLFFDLIPNKKMVDIALKLLRHFDNSTYILEYIPYMVKTIVNFGRDYYEILLSLGINATKRIIDDKKVKNFISDNFMIKIKDTLKELNLLQFNISRDCHHLFNTIYHENLTYIADIRHFYLGKFLMKTAKAKNNFIVYENCLENKKFPEEVHLNFTVKPVYVISVIDDMVNKTKLNGSLLNEKYNYLYPYCLPYGTYKNISTEMCSETDYNNIIKGILETSYNMNTSNIQTYILSSENEFYVEEYLICYFSLLIIAIPILIIIFLFLYRIIKTKISNRGEILYQLKPNQINDENEVKRDKTLFSTTEVVEPKKFIGPKWYMHLKHYFDIVGNLNELFNFNISQTDFNNTHGLTYIKGIQGLSMIFYVFGQTFLILCNLPTKVFHIVEFYELMVSFFYLILIIGLRYSPRILLACSGYTLTYKYLCFLNQEYDLYFLKFLFFQSYKYILLILVALFMRYSIYCIEVIFHKIKRPMLEIYKISLKSSDEDYIENLFSCLLSYSGDKQFHNRQNIIQYFYVALNEVVFFLFGLSLISLGYRFRLRIDFIIIILFIILYFGKIILFKVYYYDKQGMYSTLYFYLYDIGDRMLNPISNFPSFLIGMYFGLINYSMQKGISYKRSRNASFSTLLYLSKKDTIIESKINGDDEEEINLFENKPEIENPKRQSLIQYTSIEDKELKNKYNLIDNEESPDKRMYKSQIHRRKRRKNKKKSNKKKSIENDLQINGEQDDKDDQDDNDKILKEMPFLIYPTKLLNFHKQKLDKWYFKVIICFFIIFGLICMSINLIYIYYFDRVNLQNQKVQKDHLENLALEKVITNPGLNIFYSLDIELVVLIIYWAFFLIYSQSTKKSDVFEFINHIYWSFFTKSYFSFILVSSPIIIYIFYQSETLIVLNLPNVIVYSLINIVFILIVEILFYIFFELPLKKIFKIWIINGDISNIVYDPNNDNNSESDSD